MGYKLEIHPTNLTHWTPIDVLQGLGAGGLTSGASSVSITSGLLVDSGGADISAIAGAWLPAA